MADDSYRVVCCGGDEAELKSAARWIFFAPDRSNEAAEKRLKEDEITRMSFSARAFDLLVIGLMGHSALYDRVMGSTCQNLVRLAPCSVWVVK